MDSGIARYLNDRCNDRIFIYSSKRKGVLKYKTNNETVQTTQTDKRTDTDNILHSTHMHYIFTTQTDRQSDTDSKYTANHYQYNIVHTNTIRLVHMSCLFLDMGICSDKSMYNEIKI